MTFPTVISTATSVDSAATTNHVVTLPSGRQIGDIVLLNMAAREVGGNNHNFPEDWTKHFSVGPSGGVHTAAGWRVMNGTENATVTITTNVSNREASTASLIRGGALVVAQSNNLHGFGADANPDNAGSTVADAQDILWVMSSAEDSGFVITTPSTGYGNLATAKSGVVVNTDIGMSVQFRQLNATTENPGAAVADGADDWITVLFAVYPDSAIPGRAVSRSRLGI